jgi:hypothetical protein
MRGFRPRCWLLLSVLALGTVTAPATLDWSVSSSTSVYNDEIDLGNPGAERCCSHIVDNLSSSGDINNLIQFIVPGGTNQGVYYADTSRPSRWPTINIEANQTVFEGLLKPTDAPQVVTFTLYTSLPTLGQADAQATAQGGLGGPVPFPSQAVVVPVSVGSPWPVPVLAAVAVAATNGPGLVVTLTCTNVVAGLNYTVERSATLGGTNWPGAGSLSVSPAPAPYLTSAVWSETVTNAVAGFYRLKLTPP